jgi:hypothetical protein
MLKGVAASYKANVRPFFRCATCSASYHVVKLEPDPQAADCETICACGAVLPSREEQFVMKYFLLGTVRRIRKRKRPQPRPSTVNPVSAT